MLPQRRYSITDGRLIGWSNVQYGTRIHSPKVYRAASPFRFLNGLQFSEQRKALGVSHSELACPTWEAEMLNGGIPSSQALAERLIAAGYAGMLVRSFAAGTGRGDSNLVLWKWGSARPSRVSLIDEEGRLPGGSGT